MAGRSRFRSELECFWELEQRGQLKPGEFYLPSKAKNSEYSKRLNEKGVPPPDPNDT